MPKVRMEGVNGRHFDWMARNPLRAWRKENGVSQFSAASMIDVSAFTIQQWEHGAAYPKPDSVARMQRVTEIPALARQWAEWYSANPDRYSAASQREADLVAAS